jgi:hypothetical protein
MVRLLVALLLVSSVVRADDLISDAGRDMIIGFEVTSRAVYERRYQRPICPACDTTASGVTLGIGYDLGYVRESIARLDWSRHPQVETFVPYVGLTGGEAKAATRKIQHVITPYRLAEQVFEETTVVQYYRVAARTYGPPFLSAPAPVRDGLVSVVMNRGGALGATQNAEATLPPFRRNSRWEMRQIKTTCLPAHDYACVARMIRDMKRLWPNVPGLQARREIEAQMVERAL